MKYRLQPRGIAVPLDGAASLADQGRLAETFHRQYAELYGEISAYRQMAIELLTCRMVGRGEGVAPRFASDRTPTSDYPSSAFAGERPAYFEEAKTFVTTPVFDGGRLAFGHRLDGPCIVERPGDTLVIPPGMRGAVDQFHNIRIEMG